MNAEMIKENPLLVLTAIHAYAVNDFEVEPEIKELVISSRHLLKEADPEKAYREFKDIMVTNNPVVYIEEFKEVFFEFIPGLKETYGFQQNNPWHIYDVFEHTMHVLENTEAIPTLRIAALFHDLGKPVVYSEETKTREDGTEYKVGHFYKHNQRSLIFFERFANTFHVPAKEKEDIKKLILWHDYKFSTKPEKVKETVDFLGPENTKLLFALKRADNLAQNPDMTKDVLSELDEQERIYMDYINKLPKPQEPKPEKPKKKLLRWLK